MELKEFISQALKDVIDGVLDAQNYGRAKGARVNPHDLPERDEKGAVHSRLYMRDQAHEIQFDVAVTANTTDESKGRIGVVEGMYQTENSDRSTNSNQSISRIKFLIPVVLPTEKC